MEELTPGRENLSLDDNEEFMYDAGRSRKKKRKDNTTDSLELEEGPMLVEIGGRSAKARLKGRKFSKRRGEPDADDDRDWGRPAGDDDDAGPKIRTRRWTRADGDRSPGPPRPPDAPPGRGGGKGWRWERTIEGGDAEIKRVKGIQAGKRAKHLRESKAKPRGPG